MRARRGFGERRRVPIRIAPVIVASGVLGMLIGLVMLEIYFG